MDVQQNPLRLQQRAPRFAKSEGDAVLLGFERAMNVAAQRARETGQRQVVTTARYFRRAYGERVMRVQAWR